MIRNVVFGLASAVLVVVPLDYATHGWIRAHLTLLSPLEVVLVAAVAFALTFPRKKQQP